MNASLARQLREHLAARLFDVRIMQNQIRPLYVEAMVEEALGEGWRYVGGDWSGWDFEAHDGTKLEVKQSAALQSWSAARRRVTRATFDIAERTGYWSEHGIAWVANPGRSANLYLFAWHPVKDDTADQREPGQWLFYVVPAAALPAGQKTIGLKAIERLCRPVGFDSLGAAVNAAREMLKEGRSEPSVASP